MDTSISFNTRTEKKAAFCLRPLFLTLFVAAMLAISASGLLAQEKTAPTTVSVENWGSGPNGETVVLYTLTNKNGMRVKITNYGATIVSLFAPDRNGKLEDIVWGFDKVEDYWLQDSPYFGAIVGRYGNRIANGRFTIDGTTYQLVTNNGPNHLHGGWIGYDKKVWGSRSIPGAEAAGVRLSLVSEDMEEGYPGRLEIRVTYLLNNDNELSISYDAWTNKSTHCNLTNHSYFNLAGPGSDSNLEHLIMINADRYTPVDETLIPTGDLAPVKGTAFDFTKATAIGKRVNAKEKQIEFGGGYDHNFVLNKGGVQTDGMTLAARVTEPTSGRVMEVLTTEPGIQFYGGNFLDGSLVGKNGKVYPYRSAFCLETQHYPDSPNQKNFPTTLLKPGEKYTTKTVYKFSAK